MLNEGKEVLISIVIPVWEVSAYIARCLRSVMGQTYSRIECIIVDDASQDDSIAQCEQMIAKYRGPIRFSILHHSHNRGLSAARNTGTEAATGEYIYYLDSDDELPPDSIENLFRLIIGKISPTVASPNLFFTSLPIWSAVA